MTTNNTNLVIMVAVIAVALYLIYSQKTQTKYLPSESFCNNCGLQMHIGRNINDDYPILNKHSYQRLGSQYEENTLNPANPLIYDGMHPKYRPKHDDRKNMVEDFQSKSHEEDGFPTTQVTNVIIDEKKKDVYSDAIKRQDEYSMYDPLTYPQTRLPRSVLQKYNEFYRERGVYPPFNEYTRTLFDNPLMNGLLIKCPDGDDPFDDKVPNPIPLFRVKSSRNDNRYFYYIIDLRYHGKIELKIPLDHVRVNGIYYHNADFYGIPELFDGDIIEDISVYPCAKFKVHLYKTYHFP
jgi:hypothetical protein